MRRIVTDFQVGVLLLATLCCAGRANPCQAQTVEEVSRAQLIQTNKNRRITVLGVTRGVAFLKTTDPVVDGDREVGVNPVEWMQIKLFVEMLVDVKSIGNYRWELLTPEGKSLATNAHGGSTIECDLNAPRLPALLYPVRAPQPNVESGGKVLIFGESGDLYTGRTVHLKMSFWAKGSSKREEFRFIVPMP